MLLSLIVILYRNILKLPESKLEIYQSCTKTLVDKWDASKELEIDLDPNIYKEKEKVLADLAYWQYNQLSSDKTKISYDKARNTVAKTLVDKLKYQDDQRLIDLAEGFMSYAKNSSIYFNDNFTHKTFLEYYTAYWIFSNIEKKHKSADRDKLSSKYIDNPFWFIVLELLLNLIDKDQPDDEIIDDIFEKQLLNTKSIPFLLTVIHTLQNVSQNKISELIDLSILSLLDSTKTDKRLKDKIFERLQKLYYQNEQFKNYILVQFDTIASKPINEPVAFFTLYVELSGFGMFYGEQKTVFELKNSSMFKKVKDQNPYLYFLDYYLFDFDYQRKDYFGSINRFIDLFGSKDLFKSFNSQFGGLGFPPFIHIYLNRQLEPESYKDVAKNLDALEKKGFRKYELIKYLRKKNQRFVIHGIDSRSLVKHLVKEKDPQICCILLIILVRSLDNNYMMEDEKLVTLDELAKGSKIKKELLMINSLETTQEKIDWVIKYYGQ